MFRRKSHEVSSPKREDITTTHTQEFYDLESEVSMAAQSGDWSNVNLDAMKQYIQVISRERARERYENSHPAAEKNSDKAHDMALAGDLFRTAAADLGDVVNSRADSYEAVKREAWSNQEGANSSTLESNRDTAEQAVYQAIDLRDELRDKAHDAENEAGRKYDEDRKVA